MLRRTSFDPGFKPGFHRNVKRDAAKNRWLKLFAATFIVVGLLAQPLVHWAALPMERLGQQSLVLADNQGEWLHVRLLGNSYRLRPQGEVSQAYINLLLAYEDRRFYQHPGVDPLAIVRATINNVSHGRVVSGASTISMQVSRLLRPHRRTLAGKVRQAMGALWLEAHYSKQDVLDAYLTLAPYGANVEGIEMASRYWFDKSPVALTYAEAALLVALPQRPAKHRPDRFPKIARAARDRVLRKGFESGLLTLAEYTDATLSPLPGNSVSFAQLDHHLADRAMAKGLSGLNATTLNRTAQRNLNAMSANWALPPGVNVSALVLDTNGAMVAHLGSQDYFNAHASGAVDFSVQARSPGSALKPLIYAYVETAGVLRFEEVYTDQHTDFGGYTPDNFDHSEKGQQTFGDALTRSHNRAAVEALQRLSPAAFESELRARGATLYGDIGLPIAVGGIGLTLQDLAGLYTGLAQGQHSTKAHWLKSAEAVTRPMDDRSAARTTYYLRRVALPENRARRSTLNNFALKTGTGPRGSDALSVVYTRDHVIAVWVGSPDNAELPSHTGLQTAAPIALAILDSLGPERPPLSLASGPAIKPDALRQQSMKVVFPGDGLELAFPPGRDAIRPRLTGAEYPVSVVLNGQQLVTLESPRDTLRFPSAGFWTLDIQDARSQHASLALRVLGQGGSGR